MYIDSCVAASAVAIFGLILVIKKQLLLFQLEILANLALQKIVLSNKVNA